MGERAVVSPTVQGILIYYYPAVTSEFVNSMPIVGELEVSFPIVSGSTRSFAGEDQHNRWEGVCVTIDAHKFSLNQN